MTYKVLGCEENCIPSVTTRDHTHRFNQLGQIRSHPGPITQCQIARMTITDFRRRFASINSYNNFIGVGQIFWVGYFYTDLCSVCWLSASWWWSTNWPHKHQCKKKTCTGVFDIAETPISIPNWMFSLFWHVSLCSVCWEYLAHKRTHSIHYQSALHSMCLGLLWSNKQSKLLDS